METVSNTIVSAAVEPKVEFDVKVRGVRLDRSGQSRHFTFEVIEDVKLVGAPKIIVGERLLSRQSISDAEYKTKKFESDNDCPRDKYLKFLTNAEILIEENKIDLKKFIGGEFRLLCAYQGGKTYVNAAMPPAEEVTGDIADL